MKLVSQFAVAAISLSSILVGCAVDGTNNESSAEPTAASESDVVASCSMYGAKCATGYQCFITSNVGINPQGICLKSCGMYGPNCATGSQCVITSNVGINPQGVCQAKCSLYGAKCPTGETCHYDSNGGINPQGVCGK